MRVWTALQHGSTRAVAEQNAGVTIGPVGNGRKLLGTDDQNRVVGARHDELLSDLKRVNKTGTCRFKIERSSPLRSNLLLHQTRRGRKRHVGSDGRDNDEID